MMVILAKPGYNLKTYLQKNPLIEEIIYLTLFVDLFKQSAQ
jgi:hypothetical protein